ncbi:aldo/keto reductase [Alkalihalobacillus alcalophilus ATCC 27647 = CGMCC 1.3604]|uniref:Aldo/keto reductase n=1 Tax=Alkalihalobacillus alcalophilus ATCC 27647 = CGMCC 1.3604 TaxID=1218173 RepID=A0A094WM37_ALKAL|nr:aldo/keto reductase [Alkalihalobacillus alcalophilus]KGA98794.1 aldo/keto reductase [Alkalihalobacillus alcalophilus ATCC 27647 = CGMCC 1.3604]MED1560977.1 aldo/keto reductase [Alkalihalobacillus alcalophilus]THG88652.1 aldo/keto reductase [Alkalihalobacillus alcalophilus ATCC 27647 = CGMCC 1.3604]
MEYRKLGKTGFEVSEVSFGTWAIGGSWGNVNDAQSLRALEFAIDQGVNFFDTADVYGNGHSEELLAKATKGKEEEVFIATKFCRMGDIHAPENYSYETIRSYCESSLKRLNREAIDLYQIHCPPTDILKDGAVFDILNRLQEEGKIKNYGVSVETVEEGLICLENPNVKTLQVIFNLFRQKSLEQLFPEAEKKEVGILARLPLASGLLTGKFTKEHRFEQDDHRSFNENGAAFNVGETFAGLGFSKGVELVEHLKWIAEERGTMAQAAMRWILDQSAVSCVIPGFKTKEQIEDNLKSQEVRSFSESELERIKLFYSESVSESIRGAY